MIVNKTSKLTSGKKYHFPNVNTNVFPKVPLVSILIRKARASSRFSSIV